MNTKPASQANQPVAKLRIGLVSASIWQNVTDNARFHSVTFDRRYKDSKGNWKSTPSYSFDDLLQLAKLAGLAHTEIAKLQATEAE